MAGSIKMTLIALFVISTFHSFSQVLEIASPEEVGMSSERFEFLTNNLQSYVDNGDLPGCIALVARKGKIVYNKSFGYQNIETKSDITEETIFRIASQTKAIVSTAIMMLQEEGKLLILDPIGKYIPEFMETTVAVANEDGYDIVPANRPITIRDLLTHTAGIGYGGGPAAALWEQAKIQGWYFAHRDEPILATVKRMASLPNEAHPGERFVYGYNTDILGALVEVVSGQSLEEFLQIRILDPLSMEDTHFYLPENKVNRLATVYSSSDEGLQLAPSPGGMVGQGAYIEGPRASYSGGAGYLSTAEDYATFLQMTLNGGTYNNQRILSPKSIELMTISHLGDIEFPWNDGLGFGLGYSVVEDLGARGEVGSEGAYGWGGAYHSTYWVDPEEELVVVYFTQLIPAIDVDDHQKVRALIYQAIMD